MHVCVYIVYKYVYIYIRIFTYISFYLKFSVGSIYTDTYQKLLDTWKSKTSRFKWLFHLDDSESLHQK